MSPRRTKPIGDVTRAVATVLQEIRRDLGLKQVDVADAIDGISVSALHRIETGDQDITIDHLAKLAEHYGTTVLTIIKRALDVPGKTVRGARRGQPASKK